MIAGHAPGTTGTEGPGQRWGDLGVRVASGTVLFAGALLAAWAGGWLFLLVWLAAAIAVFYEWLRLRGEAPVLALAAGAGALLVVGVLAKSDPELAILVLMAAVAVQAFFCDRRLRLWVAGGQLYAGVLLLAVIALRFSVPFGSRAIIWLFAVVWSTDVFAYFGGRLIGGPKLWPRISPSKTWSGTLIGVAAGALIGTLVATQGLPAPAAAAQIFALSLAAAILSQGGDAFESALKRHFAVKDSGKLIPGHGGFMDRLDGFIAAASFAFFVGYLRNMPSLAGGLFY